MREYGCTCLCCGEKFDRGRGGQWDFAGGHRDLRLRCWGEWTTSSEYRAGASQAIPDRAALERWLTARAGAVAKLPAVRR